MGHFCTSPWDLISTYHRALSTYHQAFYVLMMGHICSSIGRLRDQKLGHFCAQSFHDHPLGHLCTCLISRSILMMILYCCLFYIFIIILSTFDPTSIKFTLYSYLREQKPPPAWNANPRKWFNDIIPSHQIHAKKMLARVSAHLRRSPALASAFVVIESEKGIELDMMLGARQ